MKKKEVSAERPRRLSMKELERQIADLAVLVQKSMNVSQGHQVKEVEELKVEPSAEPEPVKELPPLVKGQTYVFFAGVHNEQALWQPIHRSQSVQVAIHLAIFAIERRLRLLGIGVDHLALTNPFQLFQPC